MKKLVIFFSLFFSFTAWGQSIDNEITKLTPYVQALREFSRYIPQEKVYLHFDNTSYYRGDSIWFKCYLVTSGQNQLSPWSKTLYVELLNPGGEIVDKRILRVEDGQCHGEFALNQLTFYSGFYEVRAYTKYMLSFGDDVIFSRLLPVFDKPKTEGNFEEKNMMNFGRYGPGNGIRPMKREYPVRESRVNLRFFPEGGNLVQGITSRVAFEATDEAGNPIDVTVVITDGIDGARPVYTVHEGRGIFTYTPTGTTGRRRDVAEVEYSGRKYSFDLPIALPQGVVMEVDNLSHPDSIEIVLRKNINTPSEALGVAVLNGGILQNYSFAYIEDEGVSFKMDKTRLPSGVSQIVLFNSRGETLCDRLIFTANNNGFIDINAQTSKQFYMPYERVEMEFSIADKFANPVQTTFSLSVRDGANMVEGNHNVLTDLLLMSEIKGYVRNPAWYFEDTQNLRTQSLDLLLMVQGWRRYSWNQMAGIEPLEIKYYPEQAIEISGSVVSLVRQTPQPNVNVSLVLYELGTEDEQGSGAVAFEVTDNKGRFSFLSGISGKWDMFLSVPERGLQRNRILLDRVFSPKPKQYRYADLQTSTTEKIVEKITIDEETTEDTEDYYAKLFAAYQDSLLRLGLDERTRLIPEITVRAKRTQAQEIFENRSTSVAFYDVPSEADDIFDRGEIILNDIHALLMNMNPDFYTIKSLPASLPSLAVNSINEFLPISSMPSNDLGGMVEGQRELMFYKGRHVLFVVDYKPVNLEEAHDRANYFIIGVQFIKSIYINEKISTIAQYIVPTININPMMAATGFGCVVFIETYPDGEAPAQGARGARRTWLEGYSTVSEFYSPTYTALPPEPDYRRTLYWNPNVTTDENGKANITFFNNSSSKDFNISAETVTPLGMIGKTP